MHQAFITLRPCGTASLATRIDSGQVVARATGDFLVHLAGEGRERALCGQPLRSWPPQKSFREAGCADCLSSALNDGQIAVREGGRAWINLLRV